MEVLLKAAEVAEILKVPVETLYMWRHRGEGPPVVSIGRSIRYRPSDLEAWLAEPRAD